ncbi:hypothetical protein C7B09_07515 [Escherichia albertii]|uniref:Uncharacterized protein n=1 Tax=Escherichia albertii TaxID=208962 RepID=A0ABX5HJ20_ESCAL|nr:hypothetical protein C7B09_07515 [Escherichia albertii]
MLNYHYDNVVCGRAAAPGAMVAQNSDATQNTKPYREGDDVSASESFAAVCPSGISGLGGKPGAA